jgi:DNA-binding IclR family transcriptional regulator
VAFDEDELWRLVDEAAATGIGTSPEDYEAGVTGFSAAVRAGGSERPTAFVGVTGPASRLPLSRLDELRPLMLRAAAEVAAA